MNTDKTQIAIYDMSIIDIAERQRLRLVYPSITSAARMFGLNANQFMDRIGCHSLNRYLYCKNTGKKFAVRRVNILP